jgi:hypothetical protein
MIGRSNETFLLHALDERSIAVIADLLTALDMGGRAFLVAQDDFHGLIMELVAIFSRHAALVEDRAVVRVRFFLFAFVGGNRIEIVRLALTMRLNRVDLPAALGPITAVMPPPASNPVLTPDSTIRLPYLAPRPSSAKLTVIASGAWK